MSRAALSCPLCGAPALSACKISACKISACKRYARLNNEEAGLDKCASCGLVFQNPVPHELRAFYEGYRGEEGKRFLNEVEAAVNFLRRRRARLVNSFFPKPGRVLDIGCGRGLMLRELANMGWEACGTEFPGQAPRTKKVKAKTKTKKQEIQKQENSFAVYEGELADLKFQARSFDAVTLWHVFEHLEDPFRSLEEINRILKPGGLLVISVPNIESLQARLFGGNWIHLDLPRHIYHFSPGALFMALHNKGFELTECRHFSAEYGLSGVILSLASAITGKGPGILNFLRTGGKRRLAYYTIAFSILMAPFATAFITLEALLKRGGEVMVLARKPEAHP